MRKKVGGYLLLAVRMAMMSSPLWVHADQATDNLQGMADAAGNNGKSTDADKYNKCMEANPGKSDYCDCVAAGGVQLNTDVPFVGKCINKTDTQNAFPTLIGGLSKIVVTIILIASFMLIIVGGVMRTTGGSNVKKGKDMIIKVLTGLVLLGASGAILALINPNFFK